VVKHFAHLIPNYCYPTDDMPGYVNLGMAKPGGLTPDAYRNILDETIFAPSPMGNVNLECFRVYEALERGAIPIVERRATLNYFKALLGDHPIPTVRNWSEAASMIESLLKKPAEITSLQQRCFTWWQSFKSSLSDEIGGMIMARLGDDTRQNRSLYAARAETRWWQFSELLRHHNASAIRRRITKQANRLLTTGQLRVAFRPGNSAVRAK
jgi:hypothetical protein